MHQNPWKSKSLFKNWSLQNKGGKWFLNWNYIVFVVAEKIKRKRKKKKGTNAAEIERGIYKWINK